MFEWLGNAWDDFTGVFGGSDDYAGNPQSSTGQSVLSDIDIDNSGSIGSMDISDYKPDYDYSSVDDEFGGYSENFGNPFDGTSGNPGATPGTLGKPGEKPWYSSLLSPSVLGAMVTSGAGLLGGLNQMDMQKQAIAAAKEKEKMNQLLELAKLKYQLLGKGASGGGGRRSGGAGSGGANPSGAINAQASAQLASGYQGLGNNLASIYRS